MRAIVLTHGHNDHINVAVTLRDAVDAPIHLHADDRMLWDVVWPGEVPDVDTEPGAIDHRRWPRAGRPAHAGPLPRVLLLPRRRIAASVFSGDTLFCGGPGATGRSFSDEPTILRSIRDVLLALPEETIVHTGHGESTTVGAERSGVIARAAELGV